MKRNYKLRKVLQILSVNSRVRTKDLAKEIKTTQQNASHLINKLEKEKYVLFYPLLVDSTKLGFANYCVFLRIKHYSKSFLNTLTTELKKYKEITCIDFLFGDYDVFLKFTTPNASNFNKVLREILNTFSEDLHYYEILNQIVLYFYPSNYLSKKKFEERLIMSGDRELMAVDQTDKQIINMLADNARVSAVEIAKKTALTPKTVISRIKNLNDNNIIRGQSVLFDHKKLEVNRYYLFLKFNFMDAETDKKFLKHIQATHNVVELIRVFGKWDIILTVETFSVDEFKEILFKIKEDFVDFLDNYRFLESEDVRMWRYIPELDV